MKLYREAAINADFYKSRIKQIEGIASNILENNLKNFFLSIEGDENKGKTTFLYLLTNILKEELKEHKKILPIISIDFNDYDETSPLLIILYNLLESKSLKNRFNKVNSQKIRDFFEEQKKDNLYDEIKSNILAKSEIKEILLQVLGENKNTTCIFIDNADKKDSKFFFEFLEVLKLLEQSNVYCVMTVNTNIVNGFLDSKYSKNINFDFFYSSFIKNRVFLAEDETAVIPYLFSEHLDAKELKHCILPVLSIVEKSNIEVEFKENKEADIVFLLILKSRRPKLFSLLRYILNNFNTMSAKDLQSIFVESKLDNNLDKYFIEMLSQRSRDCYKYLEIIENKYIVNSSNLIEEIESEVKKLKKLKINL